MAGEHDLVAFGHVDAVAKVAQHAAVGDDEVRRSTIIGGSQWIIGFRRHPEAIADVGGAANAVERELALVVGIEVDARAAIGDRRAIANAHLRVPRREQVVVHVDEQPVAAVAFERAALDVDVVATAWALRLRRDRVEVDAEAVDRVAVEAAAERAKARRVAGESLEVVGIDAAAAVRAELAAIED